MNVNNTIDLLNAWAGTAQETDKIRLLCNDITQAVKFDLGGEAFISPDWFGDEGIRCPKLPYDKVYFEVISFDGKRYGALLENYDGDVCGQMLYQAISECGRLRGLAPVGLMFVEKDGYLQLHRNDKVFQSDCGTKWLENIRVGAVVALGLIVTAIDAMNCSNVIAVDSSPSTHINNKQAKKSKSPLFTYKTLHINTKESVNQKKHGGGTHASPRVHLRRGHVRKLANGATIWVQPCVVGDKSKGAVHKDYAVTMH